MWNRQNNRKSNQFMIVANVLKMMIFKNNQKVIHKKIIKNDYKKIIKINTKIIL